jgi:hypothetical protein
LKKLVVSYGMGVDSTAMLVGLHKWDIRPDRILFADTGGERPETYDYRPVINDWLVDVGFPEVTVIRYIPKRAPYVDLEGNCLQNITMPGLAFGRKSCSIKWKGEPLDRYVRKLYPDQQVIRAIGYDAGPKDMRRGRNVKNTPENHWWYPLRVWGWDREECKRQIAAAGLPVPEKSCCFFCPAMKPAELSQLAVASPDLARRAVAIEDGAQSRQEERRERGEKAIQGLWGNGTKGIRSEKKPGRWREYIEVNHPEVLE